MRVLGGVRRVFGVLGAQGMQLSDMFWVVCTFLAVLYLPMSSIPI